MKIKSELFIFLSELKENNNRVWFQDNKERYENDVKDPLLTFIAAFAERTPEISTSIMAIPPDIRRFPVPHLPGYEVQQRQDTI